LIEQAFTFFAAGFAEKAVFVSLRETISVLPIVMQCRTNNERPGNSRIRTLFLVKKIANLLLVTVQCKRRGNTSNTLDFLSL
jgi:hypothetical protein